MLDETYPAVYRDGQGEERTTIHNDGRTLTMELRGVRFEGSDFDGLEPVAGSDPAAVTRVRLSDTNELCACTIETEIPVPVVAGERTQTAILWMRLELGEPRPRPRAGIDREVLTLELRWGEHRLRSPGREGFFEEELLPIEEQLGNLGGYLKTCFGCAFADYSPYGNGLFGYLACFRDAKQAYLAAKTKQEILAVWDRHTELVQETYTCPEFERRVSGTGYRG